MQQNPNDMNQAPQPDMNLPPVKPDPARSQFDNAMNQRFMTRAGKGLDTANANDLSRGDIEGNADTSKLRDLIAGLTTSANQVGNFRGQAATTNIQDTADRFNKTDQGVLDARNKLAQQGEDSAFKSVRGMNELEDQGFQRDLHPGQMQQQQLQNQHAGLQNQATQQNINIGDLDFKNKKDLNDPNSGLSVYTRDFMKTIAKGQPVSDTMTAAQAGTLLPMIEQKYKMDESNASRRDMANIRAEAARDGKAAASGEKVQKRFDVVNKSLTDEVSNTRSTVGKASNGIYAASKIESLLDQAKAQGGRVTTPQLAEIASALDGMIKGGQATVSGIEHMMPNTLASKYGDVVSFLRSSPQPAELKEYLTMMADTVKREKETSKKLLSDYRQKMLSVNQDLAKADPDKWHEMMKSHHLLPEEELGETVSETPGRRAVTSAAELP